MSVYEPAEDSYLILEAVKEYLKDKSKDIKILDMGSGSGILAKGCKSFGFAEVIASDINPEVVKNLRNEKIKVIESNLFSKIDEKFDLIIFNPPYLPEDEREPIESRLQTTAGKEGYEIINKFLKDSINHLNVNGDILLLFSSLSKPKNILGYAREIGFKYKLISKDKIPNEKIYVYKFRR